MAEGKINLHCLLEQVSKGTSLLDTLGPGQVNNVELGNLGAGVPANFIDSRRIQRMVLDLEDLEFTLFFSLLHLMENILW